MILKVILPAGKIPEDASVTKLTGTVQYVLRKSLVIYSDVAGKPRQDIKADEGCVFMIGERSTTVVPASKELIWIVELDVFRNYIFEHLESHQ